MKRRSRAGGKPVKAVSHKALKLKPRKTSKAVAVRLLLAKKLRSRGLHARGMKPWRSRLRPLMFCELFRVRRGISIPSLRLF